MCKRMAALSGATVVLAALVAGLINGLPAASAQAFAAGGAGAGAVVSGESAVALINHFWTLQQSTRLVAALQCCFASCTHLCYTFTHASNSSSSQAAAGLPFPVPAALACTFHATRSPWGQPALLFGAPAAVLTPAGRTYSDVTLCCGGALDFSWTVCAPSASAVSKLADQACNCQVLLACRGQQPAVQQHVDHQSHALTGAAADAAVPTPAAVDAAVQCALHGDQTTGARSTINFTSLGKDVRLFTLPLLQHLHGIWQLASHTCPAAFVDNPAAGQALLQATTPNGTRTLRFPELGTVRLRHRCRQSIPHAMRGGWPRALTFCSACLRRFLDSGGDGDSEASLRSRPRQGNVFMMHSRLQLLFLACIIRDIC